MGAAEIRFVLTDIEGSEARHGVGHKDSEHSQDEQTVSEQRNCLRRIKRPVDRRQDFEYKMFVTLRQNRAVDHESLNKHVCITHY